MISHAAEYALRALTVLATGEPLQATHDIAKRTQVPPAYLVKILRDLNHAGLVIAQRGVGGGVKLARPAKRISLLEIVSVVDGSARKVDAPKGKAGAALAPLNFRMDAIVSKLHKSLAAVSLADVAK